MDVANHPLKFGGFNPLYYVQWIDEAWSLADARGWDSPADRDSAEARVNLARSIILSRTTLGPSRPEPPTAGPNAAGGPFPSKSVSVRALRNSRGIEFRFQGATSPPETFDLFDVQGRPVVSRRVSQIDASPENWIWRPESAGPPTAGVYFALFRGPGWLARTKVLVP